MADSFWLVLIALKLMAVAKSVNHQPFSGELEAGVADVDPNGIIRLIRHTSS
jgi:hypothetical protein